MLEITTMKTFLSISRPINKKVYHIGDNDNFQSIIPNILSQDFGASNVKVYIESPFQANSGNPITLGTLEGAVKIYSHIIVPTN